MKEIRKFFTILKIELEDLQDDIASMIEATARKLETGECTEYVCKENSALYRTEIDSLTDFIHEIDSRSSTYKTVEEAAMDIKNILPDKVRTWNYPKLMIELLDRKIDMVLGFIKELG